MEFILIPLAILVVVIALAQSLKIISQQQIGLVERLGKFRRALEPGPHFVVPIVDRVRHTLDMREQVQPFPPQGVITEDNLMVSIDSVIYFQIVDPVRAAYEAQSYKAAIEQLTMTTLRNIIGGMDLEAALTSREEINARLRAVLDEATGKWGIKVNRVELRAIEPPPTIRDAMEMSARAEREKRAQVLLAEGHRQSQILSASGDRESSILRAQGEREATVLRAQADRQSQMLRSEGEAQAITTVFNAIHAGQPTQGLLSYQYLQMLPSLARGDSNKMWIVPSELNDALKGLGQVMGGDATGAPRAIDRPTGEFTAPAPVDVFAEIEDQKHREKAASDAAVEQAIAEARAMEGPDGMRLKSNKSSLARGPQQPALEPQRSEPQRSEPQRPQQDAGQAYGSPFQATEGQAETVSGPTQAWDATSQPSRDWHTPQPGSHPEQMDPPQR